MKTIALRRAGHWLRRGRDDDSHNGASLVGGRLSCGGEHPRSAAQPARSGGWLWVPGNPLASRSGVDDPLEAAKTYIQHAAGNHFDETRVAAFLDNAGAMISFLEANSEVRFNFGKNYPDYHPDHPGGAEEGRSISSRSRLTDENSGRLLAALAQPMRNRRSWAWA